MKIARANKKAYPLRYESKKFNFNKVLKLAKDYMHRRGQVLLKYLYPFGIVRGEPKKYPDEIILTLLFLQIAWKLSFRELEFMSVQIFGRKVTPDFSTY